MVLLPFRSSHGELGSRTKRYRWDLSPLKRGCLYEHIGSSGRPVPSISKESTKHKEVKNQTIGVLSDATIATCSKKKMPQRLVVMIQTSKTIAFCSTDAKFNREERGPTRPIVWGSGWGHRLRLVRSFRKVYYRVLSTPYTHRNSCGTCLIGRPFVQR